ncbi:SGNH/GDSL hydrolase family protein [Agromyces tardus]|uniref:SGNH/GDSL hydrolase family protein n=1 Tax=Agromyces tardus TaxID=2583849 RepID=A0A3M8AJX7_9MICO|nr:SGNH/GDSL hydrolase family protein [Agromyces tardus]RNB51498.1 SGNH/GDSL hydrolase family protein [Agromyces tardus]
MPDRSRSVRSVLAGIARATLVVMAGVAVGGGLSLTMPGSLASSELPPYERTVVNPFDELPAEPLALIVGDSYTEGRGSTKVEKSWAYLAAASLGWDATIDGVGGTGFVKGLSSAGASGLEYRQRLLTHAAMNVDYDIVVMQGGLNDWAATPAQVQAATTLAIRTAREQWPDAIVVVFGPFEPLGKGVAHMVHLDTIRAATEAAGATFIDSEDPAPWLTARNSDAFDAGDGVHLNDAGAAYVAARFTAAFESHRTPAR